MQCMHRCHALWKNLLFHQDKNVRHLSYIQGQSPALNIREYFYFIDHQGMVRRIVFLFKNIKLINNPTLSFQLFLDDARIKNFTSCFKEKKFLTFFFSRIRKNETGRYETEFPYFSPCGREKNYIRCDDTPIVYTHVEHTTDDQFRFYYGYTGNELSVLFEPDKVIMLQSSGRVYHPAPERVGSIGLVKSSLAIEFSSLFKFSNGETNPPTHFRWSGKDYVLVDWYKDLSLLQRIKEY